MQSHPASTSTKTLLAEPTEKAGEIKELDDWLWEDDDDDDEEENPVSKSARETASSTTMDVELDDGVDVRPHCKAETG
jgi:hypothetical protein